MTVAYQHSTVHTVSDVRAIADHAGSYFFSRKAMSRFKSRVPGGVYAAGGRDAVPGAVFYFVTSEVFGDQPRHYAVRRLTLGTVRDNRPAVGDECCLHRCGRFLVVVPDHRRPVPQRMERGRTLEGPVGIAAAAIDEGGPLGGDGILTVRRPVLIDPTD